MINREEYTVNCDGCNVEIKQGDEAALVYVGPVEIHDFHTIIQPGYPAGFMIYCKNRCWKEREALKSTAYYMTHKETEEYKKAQRASWESTVEKT